ncbi:MAG: hypothetical protein HYX48_05710 [Chlamydiales bacterium]|nr:hypothetical protein [Chlamydiales bacterium]
MRIWKLCSLLMLASNFATAAQINPHSPNLGEVRLVPITPTAESDNVQTFIVFPKEGDIKTSNPVELELRVQGYPIGTNTEIPRAKEIYNDPAGQSMHVVIDNQPYFEINEAFVDALDNNETYYDQTLEINIPFKLKPGAHTIRVFPVRSFNESLKGDNCFASGTFYMGKKEELKDIDLSAPYITYNEPQGEYDFHPATPILLDFYITNCQLSTDGYKVEVSIDGKKERVISNWVPYYIYGLKKGSHTIHLQLIDSSNAPVPGAFNSVDRTFKIL